MRWSFRPKLWPLLGTLAGCALTIYLGVWQLHRGAQKKALDRQYAAAALLPPVELKAATASLAGLAATAVTMHGQYLDDRQLLLDDQVQDEMPGYEVWTPLRLDGGGLVIVNRGWVPHGADRRSLPPLPAPAGELGLHGLWRSLPEPGVRLGSSGCSPGHVPSDWPRIVLYPTTADLQCFYGEPLMAGEVLLAADVPGGYRRDWRISPPGFPPARHYGYAAQWFAFTLTLLVLFIKPQFETPPVNTDFPGASAGLKRNRIQFLMLLAIFLLPVLAAYAVYFLFPGLRPTATTNYGELLPQARALPPLDLRDAAGKPAGAGLFKGKWSMVYVSAASCAEACKTEIHLSRQVRTTLGLNARRLQRIYIAPDPQALAEARALFEREHPDLLLLADAGTPGQRAADFFQPGAAGSLCLVDPLGNWFMLYRRAPTRPPTSRVSTRI